MRKYEIVYIVAPDIEEEGQKELQQKLLEIIAAESGQVDDIKEWGKRKLAYEIEDQREGFYTEIHFTGTGKAVDELDRVIKITDGILMHIIVRREEYEKR